MRILVNKLKCLVYFIILLCSWEYKWWYPFREKSRTGFHLTSSDIIKTCEFILNQIWTIQKLDNGCMGTDEYVLKPLNSKWMTRWMTKLDDKNHKPPFRFVLSGGFFHLLKYSAFPSMSVNSSAPSNANPPVQTNPTPDTVMPLMLSSCSFSWQHSLSVIGRSKYLHS